MNLLCISMIFPLSKTAEGYDSRDEIVKGEPTGEMGVQQASFSSLTGNFD